MKTWHSVKLYAQICFQPETSQAGAGHEQRLYWCDAAMQLCLQHQSASQSEPATTGETVARSLRVP